MAAGTMDIRIIDGPLEVIALPAGDDGCGAETMFVGRTRGEHHADYGDLVALVYECYEAMAASTLEEIAKEAADRWPIRTLRLWHAMGRVAVGEASLLVATCTPHRSEGLAATAWIIDQLKLRAEIWKCHDWANGISWSTGSSLQAKVTA